MGFLLSITAVVCLTTNMALIIVCCRRKSGKQGLHPESKTGQFDVFRLEDAVPPHEERMTNYVAYYRISLIRGSHHYDADKSPLLSVTSLVFFSPHMPCTWESLPADKTGFCCVFNAGFFTAQLEEKISRLTIFRPGGIAGYNLTRQEDDAVTEIFTYMQEEISSDYTYKYDLIRNYISQLLHFALKMQLNSKDE
jgi:hypothetical protein